jgi:UDP-N-acetylmuramoylalanine--D-glutamate ligase
MSRCCSTSPDHLDRYDGFEGYAASKARLFEMQSRANAFVVAVDDNATDAIAKELKGRPSRITIRGGKVSDSRLSDGLDEFTGQRRWLALQGPHNFQNALCAAAACWLLDDISLEYLTAGLATYPGLPHRMERVRNLNGVLFVNDSKATNPTSTAPALAAYPALHWILGGQAKTDELDACAPHFGHVRAAYTIGESAAMFADLLRPHMAVEESGTLAKAVKSAAAAAKSGETVLLSPACASFDQFKSFEDRGDQFRALVEAL